MALDTWVGPFVAYSKCQKANGMFSLVLFRSFTVLLLPITCTSLHQSRVGCIVEDRGVAVWESCYPTILYSISKYLGWNVGLSIPNTNFVNPRPLLLPRLSSFGRFKFNVNPLTKCRDKRIIHYFHISCLNKIFWFLNYYFFFQLIKQLVSFEYPVFDFLFPLSYLCKKEKLIKRLTSSLIMT